MADHIKDISQRKAAIIAGWTYLILFMVSIFNELFIGKFIFVSEDAAKTVHNLIANHMLFRIDICHFLVVFIFDLLIAWALYFFFKQVNNSLSLLAAWFRLVYTAISVIALLYKVLALHLLSGAEYLSAIEKDQLYAQVLLFLNAFSSVWNIGLIFFAIHIFILGYLIFKSDFMPKGIGILLIIASFTFLTSSFAKILIPDYKNYEKILRIFIVLPSIIGEFWLLSWLLLKGGKISIENSCIPLKCKTYPGEKKIMT